MGPRDDEHKPMPREESWSDTAAQTHAGEEIPPAERVEQYVQLHEHIERLRQDRRPDPPAVGMPDEAPAYRMAALFRAASGDAAEPDPDFVRSLVSRIEAERDGAGRTVPRPLMPRVRRGVSRRAMLGASAAAAAAALVGAAGGALVERQVATEPAAPAEALVPSGTGVWVSVAQADAIPLGGVFRFSTDYIVGFIRHTSAGYTALSGACTHMGCLVMWNTADRTFDCPCHGGRFAEDGAAAASSPVWYKPLPKIQTRVESGQVWVYVVPPATATPPTTPSAPARYSETNGA